MIYTEEKNIGVLSNGLHLSPGKSGAFEDQLSNCHDQLEHAMSILDRHVTLIVYFIDVQSKEDYFDLSASIENHHFANYSTPYSIIAQAPVDGTKVNLEVYHCAREVTPECTQFEGFRYCTFKHNSNKFLIAGGLQLKTGSGDLQKQSMESFRLMKGILDRENMNFSHIFRQWNYIEAITGMYSCSQRYQVFNDVRSLFYSESDFVHGYPAATGIGMSTGGVIVDFLASDKPGAWPVKNPDQIDAHKYSGEVLAENKLTDRFKKSTPKFERAKAITQDETVLVYISGTAAIKGQQSLANDDAFRQTLITVDNIEQLTSISNIIKHNIPVTRNSVVEPVAFRIYVKKLSDLQKVKSAFKSRFGKMNNVLYLIADICRPELLVEIEGTYRYY